MMLEPDDCQLLCLHLQPTVVAGSRTEAPAAIASAASALAQMAASLGLPITFALIPDGSAKPLPSIGSYLDATNGFVRHSASAFLDDALVARLKKQQRQTLLMIGAMTEVIVLHSALDAIAAGYSVQVAVDAIAGRAPRTERVALDQIVRAGGTVTCVASLLSTLAPDFTSPRGEKAMALLASLSGGTAHSHHDEG